MDKLKQLMNEYGYEDFLDYMEQDGHDSVVPGICKTRDCDYTTDVEPDQGGGWCEECNKGTVVSAQILGGIM